MTVCQVPDCEEHYACRLKGIYLSTKAIPSRRATGRGSLTLEQARRQRPRAADAAWERGIAYDERPGGVKVPILSPDGGHPMSLKELADKRPHVEERLRRLHSDPNPLPDT